MRGLSSIVAVGRKLLIQSAKELLIVLLFLVATLSLFPNIPKAKATLTESVVIYASDDAWVYKQDATYLTAHDAAIGTVPDTFYGSIRVGQEFLTGHYNVYRGAVYFDTSSVPTIASITIAKLALKCTLNGSYTEFNVTVQDGQPTYPHDPIEAGDYNKNWYSGDGGSWNTTNYVDGSFINITLNSDGRSWIQKGSNTKLMLRSSRDIDADTPTGYEKIFFKSYVYGASEGPKLYITYTVDGWNVIVHGPFYENGLVAPYLVNVTMAKVDAVAYSFSVDGAGGADTVDIWSTTQPFSLVWNITSPLTNKTRTMYLMDDLFQEVYIFIPNDDEPYYLYTFTVTDFAGITDGFLETVINVNGTNQIVERQSLDLINAVPFWMTWAHRYELRIVCDEGTYNYGGFIALNEQSQGLIITKDMFPPAQPGLNITVSAMRMNATWIQVNYTDSQSQTYWLNVTIKTRQVYSWVSVYSTNNTGQTQQVNWYDANEDLDYRAVVIAQRLTQYTWTFPLPKPKVTVNPWTGLLDILGDLPFPVAQLVGVCIVIGFAGAFSYINTGLGCAIMVIIAGLLVYIGWLDIPTGAIGLALTIAGIYIIYEAKKQEREV